MKKYKINLAKSEKKGYNKEKTGDPMGLPTKTEEAMKEKVKKIKEKSDGFWADFKKFITRGNVLDMAVAVVVATAFNAIVNGLVKNIIMPLVTYLTSGVSIDEWKWVLREASVDAAGKEIAEIAVLYGLWLQAIVDFIIIAFSVFVAVRVIKKAERTLNAKEIARQEAEAAKKKEADAAAAKEAEAKKQAALEEFYANVKEQSALLREIRDTVKK